MDAIIGKTGFVGGHLIRKHVFDAQFNTRNIHESSGQKFSVVVCAAAPGSMFEANNFPDRDKEKVDELINHLSQIKAEQFVLVSSIAVLADFAGQDDESTNHFQTDLAYGKNRRALEEFCEDHFKSCLILRLPALFGHHLKKNFIFDLLNPVPSMLKKSVYDDLISTLSPKLSRLILKIYSWDEAVQMYKVDRQALIQSGDKQQLDVALTESGFSSVQFTNPDSTFQYYDIECLWSDIEQAQINDIKTLHLATEPLNAAQIHQQLTGRTMPDTPARIHHEDMYSRFAEMWGQSGHYLFDGDYTLKKLDRFFIAERSSL